MGYTNLEIANAVEVVMDLCDKYERCCSGCPLAVESDYDTLCIFDYNNEAIKERIVKLRGE